MKFSIIIPVRAINAYIKEALPHHFEQDFQDFEIIIFPNELESKVEMLKSDKLRIIASGNVGPAEKRDLAIKYAKGEILAFIDDDAYPRADWLVKALKHFDDPKVGAVGGPGVTPNHDGFLQKVSGDIYASRLTSGQHIRRYLPRGGVMEIDDWPSCNLLVRKDVFESIGGFDSNYWPGEDTKLCLDIVHKEKKKIIYDPEVLVYHHRRDFGFAHYKQTWNYAVHRGYFCKKFPRTSLRLDYFIPTFFVLGIITGIALWRFGFIRNIFLVVMAIYGLLLLSELFKKRNPLRSLIVILGIFFAHLTYGVGLVVGLLTVKLKR